MERHDEAIADYDQAIRLKPDYAEAYNNRGNAKRALERHDEAIVDYNEAIRLKPDFAEPYYNRGNAKAMLGRDPPETGLCRSLQQPGESEGRVGTQGRSAEGLRNST